MIYFIQGSVSDFTQNSVIIETSGVGYEIFMTGDSLSRMKLGETIKIFTYFHVKEDMMQLYGFLNKDDRSMFQMLLGVNGIGPKGAMGVLGGMSADDLRFAVLSDDVKTLSKAPGIGKKTAQKLILELKDKLNLQDAFDQKLEHVQSQASSGGSGLTDASKEAVEALVALGYSMAEANSAVRKVDDSVDHSDVEAILRSALKNF